MNQQRKRIAIFASGGGSNAEAIIRHFEGNHHGEIVLVCSNKPDAGVLTVAEKAGVASYVFTRTQLFETSEVLNQLHQSAIDLVVLAGFLLKIPDALIKAYPSAILNIHPSLLPKYGGKGMHGMNVHRSVIAAGEAYSGITIHLIDEAYDQGVKLFQARVKVDADDTPESLAAKVLQLEHRYYAKVIEGLCKL
jgi:phosphoribosylglycinamide formyltransferase-1